MEQVVINEEGDPFGQEEGDTDGDGAQNFKNCEQSGGNVEEIGGGDSLVDFVGGGVPCVICGVDLQVDGVVKQEEVDGEGDGEVSDEEIFQWFLKWFRLNSCKKITSRKRLTSSKGYHSFYKGKMLRFCGICKEDLIGILNKQREVDQLEREIKKGLDEVKARMQVCEGNFVISGVYDRDFSFRRLRSLIIKCGGVGEKPGKHFNRPKVPSELESSGHPNPSGRKSTRKKMPVTRFEAIVTSHESYLTPVVILSSSDKAKADVHLDIDIKPEPVDADTTSLSEDNLILPPSPSSPPPSSSQLVNKPVRIRKSIKKKSVSKKKASKLKNKSPKKTRPKPVYKPDDWEDNYFLDDDNPNEDNDKPLEYEEDKEGRAKRKRRKKDDSDEDFVLDGDQSENDDDTDFQWEFYEGRKLRYKIDPEDASKISVGSITFTITSNPPQGHQEVQCSSCSTILKHDKEHLRRHIYRHHTTRFACSKCDYRGACKSELTTHFKGVHQQISKTWAKVPCKICGKPMGAKCKDNLKRHLWTHMSQQEKDEAISSKRVEDLPQSLKKKRWQCDECGKSFHYPKELRKHKENNHQPDFEKPRELCPECGGTFLNLKGHMKYMHGGGDGVEGHKIWECTEQNCGRKFARVSLLVKHRNAVHKKIRPFKCSVCPREFSGRVSLQNHMNGHLGIRPWKCEVGECGVAFLTKAGLQRHHRIYHEEGSRPKRKAFVRGPTVLGADFKKRDLQRKGTYYPPSALKGWAKGRVPGHLMGEGEGEEGDVGEGEQSQINEQDG